MFARGAMEQPINSEDSGAAQPTLEPAEGGGLAQTANPLELVVAEEDTSPNTERIERENAALRMSILKAGEGPVVSPRNPMTRNLSFVDQAADPSPLKEVRLYERDPKPGQPGRPGSLLGPEQEEEDESGKAILIAFGIVVLIFFLYILSKES